MRFVLACVLYLGTEFGDDSLFDDTRSQSR
jgi:hypothetical protein